MQTRQLIGLTAVSLLLALGPGTSGVAAADDNRHRAKSHSYSKPVRLSHGKYRHTHRAAHPRRARHTARSNHRFKAHRYVRGYPRGHYRAYRYPRHYSHGHYYRYRHHRRDINLGAVVAGVVLGGLLYEIMDDDSSDDYEDYIEHYYDD